MLVYTALIQAQVDIARARRQRTASIVRTNQHIRPRRTVALEPDTLHSPPKIKRVRIVDNPFDDIVPRITAEEKRAQQRAREQAQREREEEQRRRGAKKSVWVGVFFQTSGT